MARYGIIDVALLCAAVSARPHRMSVRAAGRTALISLSITPRSPQTKRIISSAIINQTPNKFERFRICLESQLPSPSTDAEDGDHDLMTIAKSTMEMLSSNRRSFHRTWARMSPLIELILSASIQDCAGKSDNSMSENSTTTFRSIADVGCDHGLLSLSLACMAWSASQCYEEDKENHNANTLPFLSKGVIGSDVSANALNSGALMSLTKMNEALSRKSDTVINLPVDFRVGNGLSVFHSGETDGVILAGMGVNTMHEILTSSDLDKLDINYLFLQPTNSRPRNLLLLYDALQKDGNSWDLMDESITFLGGRWYINSYFKRSLSINSIRFPGHCLRNKDSCEATYESFVDHHIQWLQNDYTKKGKLEVNDQRWINHLFSDERYCKWTNACRRLEPNG